MVSPCPFSARQRDVQATKTHDCGRTEEIGGVERVDGIGLVWMTIAGLGYLSGVFAPCSPRFPSCTDGLLYFLDQRFVRVDMEHLLVLGLIAVCWVTVHRYHLVRVRLFSLCPILRPLTTYYLCSKRHTKSHTLCRRCGNRSFHKQHKGVYCFPLSARQKLCKRHASTNPLSLAALSATTY